MNAMGLGASSGVVGAIAFPFLIRPIAQANGVTMKHPVILALLGPVYVLVVDNTSQQTSVGSTSCRTTYVCLSGRCMQVNYFLR
jgi:hypothetical protein